MNDIYSNEATCMVENRFYEYNFEEEELPCKEDMEKLDARAVFAEYALLHARRCGYDGDGLDMGKLAAFLKKKCDEAAVGVERKKFIEDWLTKGIIGKSRENVYRLCFALQMDLTQTAEFFMKAYLERPFNYKDIREAVYSFCIRKGLSYTDAQRIIECVEATPLRENPNADHITAIIGEKLHEIETEDELIRYLTVNKSGFAEQNQSAIQKIEELIESCKKVAPKEYAINCFAEKPVVVENVDELLKVIYGYAARASEVKRDGDKTVLDEKGKPILESVHKKSINKSNFPKLVKQNWPQREQFQQIHKGTASYDVLRRALIILNFYDFSANATVKNALEYGVFDEFVDEMNNVLSGCGYAQLYWRNPFDWMIGYCAMAPNPLYALRDLIEEYFLSNPDTFAPPKK